MELTGKTAVVTGGTRGIGRAIVEKLFHSGCNVVFTFASSESLAKEIESILNRDSNKVLGIKADAGVFDDAQKTIDFAIENFGSVDILVNNAGVTKDNLLLRMSENDFEKVVNTNLKSVFNYTKAVLKPMMKNRYGKIINISSVVGIIGNPGQANYVASKAGIIGMTKSNAKELASRNININAVAPGFIETDMTDNLNDEQKAKISQNIPLNRLGKPEDVAQVVAFLAGSGSDYLTGQVIAVDGGMVM